jgi:hypothetical protein
MKIGYFGTFPYRINGRFDISSAGGVGTVSYNTVVEMAKRGHDIKEVMVDEANCR